MEFIKQAPTPNENTDLAVRQTVESMLAKIKKGGDRCSR